MRTSNTCQIGVPEGMNKETREETITKSSSEFSKNRSHQIEKACFYMTDFCSRKIKQYIDMY